MYLQGLLQNAGEINVCSFRPLIQPHGNCKRLFNGFVFIKPAVSFRIHSDDANKLFTCYYNILRFTRLGYWFFTLQTPKGALKSGNFAVIHRKISQVQQAPKAFLWAAPEFLP